MRLWTLHPKYLDAKGLVALWREGLLAKAVLEGTTRGYRNHPQLIRFRSQKDPADFLYEYLHEVLLEADRRGYAFNADKLPLKRKRIVPGKESRGQLDYEFQHLKNKLFLRDRELYRQLLSVEVPDPHPLFDIVPGGVQSWERPMNRKIDPKEFGLPARTVLEEIDTNTIAIVIHRKSRIIMADGKKILEKAEKIQEVRSKVAVSLKTSAPVCSKTKAFLEKQSIGLIMDER